MLRSLKAYSGHGRGVGQFFLEIWGPVAAWATLGAWMLKPQKGVGQSLLSGTPLTRPLSHSPEPGDEGEPGRSGLELEPEEPPGWRELVPPGTLHSLPKSQVKRQEVISGECPPVQPSVAKDTI